jgi:hypothetical protein
VADRWTQFGAGTAVVLAAWLAWELTAPPRLSGAQAPTPDDAAIALPTLEIAPPDLATLRATLERPLFDDDRRPDAPDAAGATAPETAAASKAAPVRLSAIVVAPDGSRLALVKPDGQQEAQRVRTGDSVAGWKVTEISDEAVSLAAGDQRTVVPLRVYESPSARPRARKPPRRPPAETPRRAPAPATPEAGQQAAEAPQQSSPPAAGANPAPAKAPVPPARRK